MRMQQAEEAGHQPAPACPTAGTDIELTTTTADNTEGHLLRQMAFCVS